MRIRHLAAAGVALLGLSAIVAGCGSSGQSSSSSPSGKPSTSSGKTLTILFVGGLSGATKTTSSAQLGGLKAGVQYWNTHGGFDGKQATIATVDDNSDPTTAVSQTLKYLSSNPKPDLVWAGAEGNEIAALIPLMKREGLLSMSVNDGNLQCANNSQTVCPTYFSIGNPTSVVAATAAAAFKHMGASSIGILAESIAFTQSETPPFQAALDKLGIKHSTSTFPVTAVDLTPEMSQLKSQGVKGVEAEAYGPAVGYALAARAKLAWNVPVILDAAGSSFDVSKLVTNQSYLKNTYVNVAPPTDGCLDVPGVKLMVANAKAVGASIDQVPLYVAAFGWDAALLFRNALVAAKSTDPNVLARTIVNLPPSAQTDPLLTLSKRIAYSAGDHENLGVTANGYDYRVIPAGPLVGGQLHPNCKP
jgi:ABC-type branched-subunit amino acid transport system substrate-binding protein